MFKETREVVEEMLITGFLEDSVHEFEVCCRRAIESVLAAPTMNAGRFAISRVMNCIYRTTCTILSENEDYSATIAVGVDSSDLAALVPADSELEMQLDAVAEITNVLSGSFVTHRRFSERFGAVPPSLPAFANGRSPGGQSPGRDSWCIQGQLRVNSVKVFVGVAIRKSAREGIFPCKNPL